MKRTFFLMTVLAFVLMGSGWVVAQQQGQDYGQNYNRDYGPRGQGWFCPWCGGRSGRGGMGPGMMQGWGGPGYGMGPGMMRDWGNRNYDRGYGMRHRRGGRGYGMGRGGMHGWGGQGYGRGPGMMHDGWGRGQYGPYGNQEPMQPLSKNSARDLAENYVAGNPNLKIGDVVEEDNAYIASIVTKDGSLVEKLIIDKRSGWMRRAY